MTTPLQAPVEDLAYALADPETGLIAVLTVACHVPAPVQAVIEALEALVAGGGGTVMRDELDGMRAVRFRDPPGRGKPIPAVHWPTVLAEIDPDDAWLTQARLDHDVLAASAGAASPLDPAQVAGVTARTLAEVLERLGAWAAQELIVSAFDGAAGKQRFRLPTVSPLPRDAASAIAPKPVNRKPLYIALGVVGLVVVIVLGLRSSAAGDLQDAAAVCRKKQSQLTNVEERRAQLERDLKPIMSAPGVTPEERTRLMDELTGATNRVTVERKRLQEAAAAYEKERGGWIAGLAASSDDDTTCGYGQ